MPQKHMPVTTSHFRPGARVYNVIGHVIARLPLMKLFPLFADLRQRRVFVVGGGIVAERKATALLAGAVVSVGAPNLTATLADWAETVASCIVPASSATTGSMAPGWSLPRPTSARSNQAVAEAANARGIFVNVVDDAALSSFHVPAIVGSFAADDRDFLRRRRADAGPVGT